MSAKPVLSLQRLHLDRLPGVKASFAIDAQPGVNLIVGPNEAGKSSLVRTVFQLLWPENKVATPFSVRGEFVLGDERLTARQEGNEPVTWLQNGNPSAAPDLPGEHVAHCYRMGLLDLNRRQAGDLDQRLAREVQRQMAGGFDLSLVRELFPEQNRRLKQHSRDWNTANQNLEQCQTRQKSLAQQEQQLSRQEDDKQRALQARQQVELLEAALARLELTQQESELLARLTELPVAMAQIRPDDHTTLAELQQRVSDKSHQIQELRDKTTQQAAHLAEIEITADLSELAGILREAALLSARVDESARNEAHAVAALESAHAELAPELLAAEIPAAAEAAFTVLAQAHRDLADRQAQLENLEYLLALAVLRDQTNEESNAVPDAALALLASGILTPPNRTIVIGGLINLLAAAAFFYSDLRQQDETGALGVGLGVMIGVVGATNIGRCLLYRRAHQRALQEMEMLCREAGNPLPAAWTPEIAANAFMAQAQHTGEQDAGQQARTELRQELERRRDDARQAADNAAAQRQKHLRDLGQDEQRETPGLLHDLDRVARCRAAQQQLASQQGEHAHNESALATILAEGQGHLAQLGHTAEPTVIALQAGLDRLHTQRSEAQNLREVQTHDEAALSQAEHELEQISTTRQSLLSRLNLTEVAEITVLDLVTSMVEALPEYQELTGNRKAVQHDIKRLNEQLAAETEILTEDELNQHLTTHRELAAGAHELLEEIAHIRGQIESARSGEEWELARAQTEEKAHDLTDLVAEQRLGILGNLLLNTIEKKHEANTQPPLLKAMNKNLAGFTEGRYHLRVVGDGDDQRFVAMDLAEQPLQLTELSDGTRAQLLLAARLAFLDTSETGLLAPLFLDEALTASDPTRFDDIAGAVGQLAASTGRQVFYLTSNPTDLAAWQRALTKRNLPVAHEINLAEKVVGEDTATKLGLPDFPTIPRPDGLDAAAYGAAIPVPSLQPWAHENEVHLFYLWKDNLDLVHRLLQGGLPRLGQWRRLGSDLVLAGIISTDEADRIEARGQIYGAFRDTWQIGRGRPLTPEVLTASELLSAAMMPLAVKLLAEVHGDGAAFIEGAKSGKIKRLNRDKKEALQDYLERQGHLDNRPVWAADQIVAHVLGAVGKSLAAGVLAPDEVRQLVLDLYRVTGSRSA